MNQDVLMNTESEAYGNESLTFSHILGRMVPALVSIS